MANSSISRRTVAAGAAWAVPAIMTASAVPSFAASPEPGLNGWLLVSQGTNWWGQCTLTFDGRGDEVGDDGDPFGMYVWDVDSRADVTSTPTITVTLPYPVSWTSRGNSEADGWSTPTLTSSGGGQYKYTSTYTGTYTTGVHAEKPTQFLTGRPVWVATSEYRCPSYIPLTLTRCAQIKSEDLCFDRSISFGRKPFSGARSVEGEAAPAEPMLEGEESMQSVDEASAEIFESKNC